MYIAAYCCASVMMYNGERLREREYVCVRAGENGPISAEQSVEQSKKGERDQDRV